ncbi:hypothetical protein ACIOFV_39895 [Streptomyces mirabilis]|uniref:hypothetical protein n=1 Tax=Streptomyces mirabilis TaxID=68239 RepID=UPI0038028A5B
MRSWSWFVQVSVLSKGIPKALTAELRSGSNAGAEQGLGAARKFSGGAAGTAGRALGGYPVPVALTNDEGWIVVVGGDDGVMLPLGVAGTVAGGPGVAVPEGVVPTKLELSVALWVVIGAVGVVGTDPVGLVLGGRVGDGVMVAEEEPVEGRGTGAWGWSRSGACGSRTRPTPSPAATSTEPTAFCAARTRRRTSTPVLSRSCCAGSKGVYSWVSRIIRANSRSK